MANEVECAGCGEPLDLFKTHLQLSHKPIKHAMVHDWASGEEGEEADTASALGTRSGIGETAKVCSYACAAEYYNEKSGDEVKLRYLRDDPEADARGND